eukprot:3429350-Amphidinium_carterae.1
MHNETDAVCGTNVFPPLPPEECSLSFSLVPRPHTHIVAAGVDKSGSRTGSTDSEGSVHGIAQAKAGSLFRKCKGHKSPTIVPQEGVDPIDQDAETHVGSGDEHNNDNVVSLDIAPLASTEPAELAQA